MRIMYGCVLLCTSLSCDNPPRSREERLRLLEHRVATLEAVTDNHDIDLAAMRRRQDKERVTAEAETAGLVARKPVEDRCPNPIDRPWREEQRPVLQVNEPPAGAPEFKIHWGVWHEPECLSSTARSAELCRVPEDRDLLTSEMLSVCGYPSHSSWAKLLTGALNTFVIEPSIYENEARVYVAYGLLQTGNSPSLGNHAAESEDFRTRVLPLILRSRRLTGLLYDWAMPNLKTAWQALKPSDQQIYLAALAHGQRYLASFSERRELACIEKLKRGQCSKPEWVGSGTWNPMEDCESVYFTTASPDGTDNPYRKLETFFFRRARQGVKVADMRYWLDRVVAELRPLTPAEATAAK